MTKVAPIHFLSLLVPLNLHALPGTGILQSLTAYAGSLQQFLARDVIYTSRAYAVMPLSVYLSICQ